MKKIEAFKQNYNNDNETYRYVEGEFIVNGIKFKREYGINGPKFTIIYETKNRIPYYFDEILVSDNGNAFIGYDSHRGESYLFCDGDNVAKFSSYYIIGKESQKETNSILQLRNRINNEDQEICFLDCVSLKTFGNVEVTDFLPTNSFVIKNKYVSVYDGRNKKAILYNGKKEKVYEIEGYRVLDMFNNSDDLIAVRNETMPKDTFKLMSLCNQELVCDNMFPVIGKLSYFDFYKSNELQNYYNENGVECPTLKYLVDILHKTVVFEIKEGITTFHSIKDANTKKFKKEIILHAPKYNSIGDPTIIKVVENDDSTFNIFVGNVIVNRCPIKEIIYSRNGLYCSKYNCDDCVNQIKCTSVDDDYDILDFKDSQSSKYNKYTMLYRWRYGNLNCQ